MMTPLVALVACGIVVLLGLIVWMVAVLFSGNRRRRM